MMPDKIADDDLVLQWLFSLYAIAFSLLLSFGGVFLKFPISPGLAPAGAGQVLQALCLTELYFFKLFSNSALLLLKNHITFFLL